MSIVTLRYGTPFVSSARPIDERSAGATADADDGPAGRLELGLLAAGYMAIPHAEIDPLRRKAPAIRGLALPPGFLKPVDEQTVCVYCAVAQAVSEAGLEATQFKEWGVLAAPRFLGRVFDAGTFHKFLQIGGGGVSVHLIPQQSQHAVSGAISVALGMQGPNFGIAGGPGSVSEGLTTAFSTYDPSVVPGMWLLLSEFDPEARPDRSGQHTTPAVCHALALALTHQATSGPRLALSWPGGQPDFERNAQVRLSVAELAGPIVAAARGICRDRWNWDVAGGFRLELAKEFTASPGGGTD